MSSTRAYPLDTAAPSGPPRMDTGDLVRVLDVAWPQEFAYWLVSPRATADQPKIVAFREWLLAEGRRISASARPARRAGLARTP